MTNEELINYVNLVLNKEQKGNSLSPARRNTALQSVNIILFERLYQRVGETAAEKVKPLYDVLMSNRSMKRYVNTSNVTITIGEGNLPTGFREQLSATLFNDKYAYPVDFVSEERLERFRFSMMETPKTDEYAGIIRGSKLFVYPVNSTPLTLSLIYLKEPTTPVYDYCIGTATDHEYYMPVGSIIENGSLKLNGVTLQTNVVSSSGLTTGYTSRTVELDWDSSMHIAFANEILLLLGVNLQDQLAIQHAQNERMIK